MLNLKNKIIELNNIYKQINLVKLVKIKKNDIDVNKKRLKKKIKLKTSLYCRLIQKKNNSFVHINHPNSHSSTEMLITPNLLSIKNLNKEIKGKKSNYFLQEKLFDHLLKFLNKNRNKNYLILSNTEKQFNNLVKQHIKKSRTTVLFQKIKWNIRKSFN
jgi:hypothetical protein